MYEDSFLEELYELRVNDGVECDPDMFLDYEEPDEWDD